MGLGTAAVGDLTLESEAILQANQPDSFVLGTLEFDTLSIGTSALTISLAVLLGELDASGFVTELQAGLGAGSIEVSPIPVPAAIWLFGTGLIGLIGFSKRRKMIR
ncbi:MAG: PEP-CTERM sorting domain-containing protein [Gammaproteobacteria bacterium]|nr:PEP-CTERM sorting domain-containing protein [Gammaproteobacteria bacterium]